MQAYVHYVMMCVAVTCLHFGVLVRTAVAVNEPKALHPWLQRMRVLDYEIRLREKGYDPADIESVRDATADRSYPTRTCAVRLLAARTGEQAIPMLKQALHDSSQMVRCSAATLLAVFGDEGGLARMRKDLADMTPKKSATEIDEAPDLDDDQKLEAKRHRTLHLKDALAAAEVLAEFGDHSGDDLAIKTISGDEYSVHRSEAIKILSHISNTDLTVLRAENRDPDAVLLRLAETEQEDGVIRAIQHYANVHRRFDVGTRILETLAKSPHVPEDRRKNVEASLEYRRQALEKAGQSAMPQQTQQGKE